MNRLEFPPPPTAAPRLPLPPAPTIVLPAPRAGHRSRRVPVSVAAALVFLLVTGITAVLASDPAHGRHRPLFGGARSHSFIGRASDGTPFRWDPCSTIHYQVDLGTVDDHVLEDVEEAVRRTSEASGLTFQFDGVVHGSVPDLVASGDFVTQEGGLHWSPVLIAFRSGKALRAMGIEGALGATLPITTRFDADQFVSGVILINTDAGMLDGFGPGPSMGTTLQHEWGHAVGLGHILDPLQLMSPMPIVSDWGTGDLAGLRRLGRGPCLDVPTAEFDAAIFPSH
ncbi:MAG TPA: hypothetical protein VFM81_00800 [Actinomycetota bacterium]|nr:hypothetical protein [Actinomycetota bacterium]